MKSRILMAVSAVALLGTAAVATAQTIVIQEPQERYIREYVVREQVEPAPSIDFDVTVGSIVPDTVELRTVRVPDADIEYRYVRSSERTIVVEPDTHKIIRVLD